MYRPGHPVYVEFDAELSLWLTPLSADGHGALHSYIIKSTPKYSAQDKLMANYERMTAEDRLPLLMKAIELDHETAMREQFNEVLPPRSSFFLPEVCAFWLLMLAIGKQSTLTHAECLGHVIRLGGGDGKAGAVRVIAKISQTFPPDPEKNDLGPSDSPADGPQSTGQSSATESESNPKAQ